MKWYIRKLIALLPASRERKIYEKDFKKEFEKWQSHKLPPVPHLLKQQTVSYYQKQLRVKTLVETGTYLGDMIYIMEPLFDQLYSIELSPELYKKAVKRFAANNKIHLYQGDSGAMIQKIVSELKTPAIFWLDGHYSGGITARGKLDTPVVQELKTIFESGLPHIILVDDARLFVGSNDYPTVEEVINLTEQFATTPYTIKVENDIIQIVPKS